MLIYKKQKVGFYSKPLINLYYECKKDNIPSNSVLLPFSPVEYILDSWSSKSSTMAEPLNKLICASYITNHRTIARNQSDPRAAFVSALTKGYRTKSDRKYHFRQRNLSLSFPEYPAAGGNPSYSEPAHKYLMTGVATPTAGKGG